MNNWKLTNWLNFVLKFFDLPDEKCPAVCVTDRRAKQNQNELPSHCGLQQTPGYCVQRAYNDANSTANGRLRQRSPGRDAHGDAAVAASRDECYRYGPARCL